MARIVRHVSAGDLQIMIHTFEKAGDPFDEHTHTELDAHITIVASGSARCTGPGIDGQIIRQGDVVDPGLVHGFVALEDETIIVNVVKKLQR